LDIREDDELMTRKQIEELVDIVSERVNENELLEHG
jgi:hypothetical protein